MKPSVVLTITVFLASAAIGSTQRLDVKVDQLIARNPLNNTTTVTEGKPLKIRCFWTVRLTSYYWETDNGETWTNAITIDGKVIQTFEGSIEAGTCFGQEKESNWLSSKSTNCGLYQVSGNYGPYLWTAQGAGTHTVACTVNTDQMISDSDKTNNTVSEKILVTTAPADDSKETKSTSRSATLKSPASATNVVAGVVGAGVSSGTKSCRTSLTATVEVDPQQLSGPMFGPANTSQTELTLYLKESQASADHIRCFYASANSDVPSFVVAVQCANATPKGTTAHEYDCGD